MSEKRNFYRMIFALIIPIALQNLINVAVQSMDVVMLGKLTDSKTAISAASLGGQISFVMSLILFGLSSGLCVLTAQYWGKKDMESIKIVFGMSLRISLVVGLIFTVAALVIPQSLMWIFTSEEAVALSGAGYLQIVCFSYVLSAVTMVYLNVMRSLERVVVATVIYTVSLFVNVFFNWVFIFGNLGVPAMGVKGAAIGTVIARASELIMVFIYDRKWNRTLQFRLRILTMKDRLLRQDFLKYATPVMCNEMMWGLGMSMTTAILGNLGSDASSANAIAQVVRQLSQILVIGIANATAITVGKVIGEKRMDLAQEYGRRFTRLGLVSGLLGSLVVLAARPVIFHFLNLDGLARDYLGFMLYGIAVYVIAQSVNTLWIVGLFRGGGDTRFGLIMDVTFLWGSSVFLGWIAAYVLHWEVKAVYLVILSDEFLKFPFIFARYRSGKWLNNVTRERKEEKSRKPE